MLFELHERAAIVSVLGPCGLQFECAGIADSQLHVRGGHGHYSFIILCQSCGL